MGYEKRLLVLSGDASGCLRLEKTSVGIACHLTGNVKGECVLVLRDDVNFLCFGNVALSSAYRFSLPVSFRLDALVAAVGDAYGRLIMYGGFKRPMPWRSNLEDDLARALRSLGIRRVQPPKAPVRDINDFFLDIVPTDYDDTRVAEVNYYRSNLSASVPEPQVEGTAAPEPQPVREQPHVSGIGNAPETEPPSPPDEPPRFVLRRPTDAAEEHLSSAPRKEQPQDGTEPDPLSAAESVHMPETRVSQKGEVHEEIASTVTEPAPPIEEKNYESREEKIPELSPVSFYESVRDQVERLFAKNERYTALERLLPESRWIKVNYDSRGRYYLVGVIGDPVRYLCYGVPGEYSPNPPPDLVGYCQWLALDEKDPAGKGFWIMYQDGVTGKSVL